MVTQQEEEKLARDVYRTLSQKWQGAIAFSNIDDSEEQYTTTVRDKLLDYGISDPSTSDEDGVFTGADYGKYFTGKYNFWVEWGKKSLLDALYVGGFIEELDMLDIVQCPDVVIKTHDSITLKSDCGLNYTDNRDTQRMYEALLDEGSTNHLRSYVGNIGAPEGECAYNPPALLDREYFEEIVGRTCPDPE